MAKITASESLKFWEDLGLTNPPRRHDDRVAALKPYIQAQEERAAISERTGVQGKPGRPVAAARRIALATELADLFAGKVDSVTLHASAPFLQEDVLVKDGAFKATAAVRAAIQPIVAAAGERIGRSSGCITVGQGEQDGGEGARLEYVVVSRRP